MIPKVIHYCWFGGKDKPKLAKKCIASWEKYCPDYQIIEWNEKNFHVSHFSYTQYCYDQKKWAFLSDFVRLQIIYDQGGIYLDTDVEYLRNPDFLLSDRAFFGFENDHFINTGLGFGAEKGHPVVHDMLWHYQHPDMYDEGFKLIKCPELNTRALLAYGLQKTGKEQMLSGIHIYPAEFFNPYDDPTGRLNKTDHTVSIHWYSKSWMNRGTILRSQLMKPFHRIFGTNTFSRLRKEK